MELLPQLWGDTCHVGSQSSCSLTQVNKPQCFSLISYKFVVACESICFWNIFSKSYLYAFLY